MTYSDDDGNLECLYSERSKYSIVTSCDEGGKSSSSSIFSVFAISVHIAEFFKYVTDVLIDEEEVVWLFIYLILKVVLANYHINTNRWGSWAKSWKCKVFTSTVGTAFSLFTNFIVLANFCTECAENWSATRCFSMTVVLAFETKQLKYEALTLVGKVGLLKVNIMCFIGSTFLFSWIVIQRTSTISWFFRFSRILSLVESNNSGYKFTPCMILRVGWIWKE